MTRIDTVSIALDAETQGFINGMRDAGNIVQKQSGSIFGNIGKVTQGFFFAKEAVGALVGAGAQMYQFGQAVFDLGADAEETASKFSMTLGPAADKAQRFLEKFANTAGLTVTEGRELIATTTGIAMGFGMGQEEAADFAKDVAVLAGDMTSYTNIPIEETSRAVQSALAGERESLKRLGVIIKETDVQKTALMQTGKDNAKALTDEEKATATLTLIQERAAYMMGNLEATQDSAANTARRLGAEFRQMQETLARALQPALTAIMGALADMMGSSGMDGVVDAVIAARDQIAAWALVAIEAFKAAATSVAGVIDTVIQMGMAVYDAGEALHALVTLDFTAFKGEVSDLRTRFANVTENVGQTIGSLGNLRESVVTAMQTGKAEVDEFRRGMNEADKQVIETTSSVVEQGAAIVEVGTRVESLLTKYKVTETSIRNTPLAIDFGANLGPEAVQARFANMQGSYIEVRDRIRAQALEVLTAQGASPEIMEARFRAMESTYGSVQQMIRDQRIIIAQDPNSGPAKILETINLLAPGVQRAADEIRNSTGLTGAFTESVRKAEDLRQRVQDLAILGGPAVRVLANALADLHPAFEPVANAMVAFIDDLAQGQNLSAAIGTAIGTIKTAGLALLIDTAIGVVADMFAKDARARAIAEANRQAMVDNRRALEQNTETILRSLTGGMGGEQLVGMANLLAEFTRRIEASPGRLPEGIWDFLYDQLRNLGMSLQDFYKFAEGLGLTPVSGNVTWIIELGKRINELVDNQLAGFAETLTALQREFEFRGTGTQSRINQLIAYITSQTGTALDQLLIRLYNAPFLDQAGAQIADIVSGLRSGNRNLIGALGNIPINDFVSALDSLFALFRQREEEFSSASLVSDMGVDGSTPLNMMFDPILMDVGEAAVQERDATELALEQDRIAYDAMINRLDALDSRLNTLIGTNRTGFEDVAGAVLRR